MTPQEAIEIIDDVTWDDNGRHYGKIAPARDLSKSALEKQIPQKTTKTVRSPSGRHIYGYCPKCNAITNNSANFCGKCGQALDWSDTE